MNNQAFDVENSLIEQLQAALEALDGVVGKPIKADRELASVRGASMLRHDADIEIMVAGRRLNLMVECKMKVYPREVRDFLGRASHYILRDQKLPKNSASPEQLVPVLAGGVISSGAKDMMRREQVGYFDAGGSLYIPAAPGILLLVDRPPAKEQKRAELALFKGSRAQIIHAMLNKPGQWWSVKNLAESALVSSSLVSGTLTELEQQEWVLVRGKGPAKERKLESPSRLLDEWAKQTLEMRPPTMQRYFVPRWNPDQIVLQMSQEMAKRPIHYAITHEVAAQRYAPFLSGISQVRCRWVGSREHEEDMLNWMRAEKVEEGANFALIDADSEGDLLFSQEVDGAKLASPIQVYLDLQRGEGRAKEMAAHLREAKIGF